MHAELKKKVLMRAWLWLGIPLALLFLAGMVGGIAVLFIMAFPLTPLICIGGNKVKEANELVNNGRTLPMVMRDITPDYGASRLSPLRHITLSRTDSDGRMVLRQEIGQIHLRAGEEPVVEVTFSRDFSQAAYTIGDRVFVDNVMGKVSWDPGVRPEDTKRPATLSVREERDFALGGEPLVPDASAVRIDPARDRPMGPETAKPEAGEGFGDCEADLIAKRSMELERGGRKARNLKRKGERTKSIRKGMYERIVNYGRGYDDSRYR